MKGGTLGSLAEACFLGIHRASPWGPYLPFDARTWIEQSGPSGPRVVVIGLPLPVVHPSSDVVEEADVGVSRAASRREKFHWIRVIALVSVALACGLASSFFARPPNLVSLLVFAGPVCIVLSAAYRIGLRPIDLAPVVAT